MKIYLTAYATGGGTGAVHGSTRGGDVLGCALSEDGLILAEHLSSSEAFARHDLGLTSDWKHDRYREYAPDGYELEWVADRKTHAGWIAAFALNKQRGEETPRKLPSPRSGPKERRSGTNE